MAAEKPDSRRHDANIRPAGIRIDGGKRINLAGRRARRQAAKDANRPLHPQPTPEQVKAKVKADRKKLADEEKRLQKLREMDGGKDGAKVTSVRIKLSAERGERQAIRCKPGTFEWRYGRDKQDALFHAGSYFARLWERAGVAVASSANFLRGIKSGYQGGISDARVAALETLIVAVDKLGEMPTERLTDYCVSGLTTAEIARKHATPERDMAAVIHQDLRSCARHFRFISG